jgi:lipoate-protein ligase A
MGETWRLLHTFGGEPGWNMALDEALLASGEPRPTLRFYTWSPPALSLGYFQRWRDLPQLPAGLVVVRRFSGGGAIEHSEELTFSIAASADHALFRGDVRRSYEQVHALLARAFATFGVEAAPRAAASLRSEHAASSMCFHRATAFDLAWDGAKGVGSAQRRRQGRVLHHGSIKLAAGALEHDVAGLRDHAPDVAPGAVAAAITAEFERGLGCAFALEAPSASESAHAERRADHYRSADFVRRR